MLTECVLFHRCRSVNGMTEQQQDPVEIYRKKSKKSLRAFEVLTRVELDNSSKKKKTRPHKHFTVDDATNEVYVLSQKCNQCGSVESTSESDQPKNASASVSATASCTVSSSSSSNNILSATALPSGNSWLSEQDLDEIVNSHGTEREKNTQRRHMYEREEIKTRTVKNKLRMLESLRVYNTTQVHCEKLINAALQSGKVSVNVNAFIILEEDDLLIPYTKERGGCEYELVRNKHELEPITKKRLFDDMIRHQEAFKQLLHVFHFLENQFSPTRPLEYIIYKRKIELMDSLLLDGLDFWDKLERLFIPIQEGYYYAIVVCLGFSLSTVSATETIKTKTRKISTTNAQSPDWV